MRLPPLNRTLGPAVVSWIEANLVHGPGDVQGQPILLDDEQVAFVMAAYEIDEQGRRVVRRGVYSRPKGRAKSELAAMISCAELLGPVRFAGWDRDGFPVGAPVQSPIVLHVATEEGQAGNTYAAAEFMLRHGAISEAPGLDVGMTRTLLPDGGYMRPITAKSTSKDGGKETFVVFDETHLYSSAELRKLHDTIRRNLAKRKIGQPWALETSTMYAPGEESVAEFSHRYAQAIAEGRVNDPGFLFDHRQSPELSPEEFADDDMLRQALVEAYGEAAAWMDIERLIAEARDPMTAEADYRRYFLNLATDRSESWVAPSEWAGLADEKRGLALPAEGTELVLAFDGSYNRDSTALVGCVPGDVPYLFVVGAWERPPDARTDWQVDRDEVKAVVAASMRRWRVLELACDPPGWHDEVDGWAAEFGSPPVVKFETKQSTKMGPACSRFFSAVKTGEVAHDGNPILARHLRNARTKETANGAVIVKEHRSSPRKIDAAVAAVVALEVAATRQPTTPFAMAW